MKNSLTEHRGTECHQLKRKQSVRLRTCDKQSSCVGVDGRQPRKMLTHLKYYFTNCFPLDSSFFHSKLSGRIM